MLQQIWLACLDCRLSTQIKPNNIINKTSTENVGYILSLFPKI